MKSYFFRKTAIAAVITGIFCSIPVFANAEENTDINIAINKPAYATSELGNYSASLMTDGRLDTRWATIDDAPQSIDIESKEILEFNKLSINEYTPDGKPRIQNLTIEYSPDRVTWYPCTLVNVSEPVKVSDNSIIHTIEIDKVSGKGVRVNITEAAAPPSIWEIEVYHSKISKLGMVIGNYVKLGKHNGEELLWRVADIDDNGPLLILDEAVSNPMEYDAAGDVITGSHSRGSLRIDNGSDFWNDSNIKDWLNSDKDGVVYSCGNEPSYKDSSGFLSEFTDDEKNLIKSVEQPNILSVLDKDTDGVTGTQNHAFIKSIIDVVQNYDNAYKNTIKDKIFLPDVKQLYTMYCNREILGDNYYVPTVNGSYVHGWVRTPVGGSNGNDVRIILNDGIIGSTRAFTTSPKIYARPMMYLAEDNAVLGIGDGSLDLPYTIKYLPEVHIEFNKTTLEAGTSLTATVTTDESGNSGLKCYMALYRQGYLEKIDVTDIDEISKKAELMLDMPDNISGCNVRVFVWNDDMRPISTSELGDE